jgi:hypothetical protein
MNNLISFAVVRNASDKINPNAEKSILIKTTLTDSLIKIIQSSTSKDAKVSSINSLINQFLESKQFLTNPENVNNLLNKGKIDNDGINALHDNLVIRTLTQSNNTPVFNELMKATKQVFMLKNPKILEHEIEIILPEGLTLRFPNNVEEPKKLVEKAKSLDLKTTTNDYSLNELYAMKSALADYNFAVEHHNSLKQDIETSKKAGIKIEFKLPATPTLPKFMAKLKASNSSEALQMINERIINQELEVARSITTRQIGPDGKLLYDDENLIGNHVEVDEENGNSIVVLHKDCNLRFPFKIADLKTVDLKAVGYVPNEIAHIHNVQGGEKHSKTTRRLKKIESFESFMSENEVFRETDTQSTEKFSIEKEAAAVKEEEMSINVNAGVRSNFGTVKASLDAGFAYNQSQQNSNSTSEQYARETVQKIVDRVSNRVRIERSMKTIEEFEETVEHIVDNSDSQAPKSYVYRWLTKIVQGTLTNYGKRLIFNIDLAHPSAEYLKQYLVSPENKAEIPDDPRGFKEDKSPVLLPNLITRNNYIELGNKYKVMLPEPKPEKIIIGKGYEAKEGSFTRSEEVQITPGYETEFVHCADNRSNWSIGSELGYIVGIEGQYNVSGASHLWGPRAFPLAAHTGSIPVTLFFKGNQVGVLNIRIYCKQTQADYEKWQMECYKAIIDGYTTLKEQAEESLNSWNPNNPGMAPLKKLAFIREELKREIIKKILDCNDLGASFQIKDNYKDPKDGYEMDCCLDAKNAEQVKFIEHLFDWNNLTYEFFPYFYGNKDNWNKISSLQDDDPHFEAFMKASYATVYLPVHRDTLKERASINFMLYNSIANYGPIPASAQNLIAELETASTEVIKTDIGLSELPTDLVILECATADGIKPIADSVITAEILSKFKSPTIIADHC